METATLIDLLLYVSGQYNIVNDWAYVARFFHRIIIVFLTAHNHVVKDLLHQLRFFAKVLWIYFYYSYSILFWPLMGQGNETADFLATPAFISPVEEHQAIHRNDHLIYVHYCNLSKQAREIGHARFLHCNTLFHM